MIYLLIQMILRKMKMNNNTIKFKILILRASAQYDRILTLVQLTQKEVSNLLTDLLVM